MTIFEHIFLFQRARLARIKAAVTRTVVKSWVAEDGSDASSTDGGGNNNNKPDSDQAKNETFQDSETPLHISKRPTTISESDEKVDESHSSSVRSGQFGVEIMKNRIGSTSSSSIRRRVLTAGGGGGGGQISSSKDSVCSNSVKPLPSVETEHALTRLQLQDTSAPSIDGSYFAS